MQKIPGSVITTDMVAVGDRIELLDAASQTGRVMTVSEARPDLLEPASFLRPERWGVQLVGPLDGGALMFFGGVIRPVIYLGTVNP